MGNCSWLSFSEVIGLNLPTLESHMIKCTIGRVNIPLMADSSLSHACLRVKTTNFGFAELWTNKSPAYGCPLCYDISGSSDSNFHLPVCLKRLTALEFCCFKFVYDTEQDLKLYFVFFIIFPLSTLVAKREAWYVLLCLMVNFHSCKGFFF